MNHALRFTLLGLAVVVVLFAVTWFSLPGGDCSAVSPPASLFAHGLDYRGGGVATVDVGSGFRDPRVGSVYDCTELDSLKSRIAVFYGSVAAVIILVGLAFGAGRRSSPEV